MELAISAAAATKIKVENPSFLHLKEQLAVLKSAKVPLEKAHSQGSDLAAQLKLLGESDGALKPKANEVTGAMNRMYTFLQDDVRSQIAITEALRPDSEGIEEIMQKNKAAISLATAHKDGWAAMHKRMKPFLA